VLAVTVGVLALTAACGAADDGRTLRPPEPDQTTTTSVAPPATTAAAAPLRMSSPTIAEGGVFPVDHTCRGRDVSPPLSWSGVPNGTVELAVVVRDVDEQGFVHWVVAGLPATTGGLAEATVPAGSAQAANDFGRPGWSGPCPPAGTHNYEIRLYALAQPSGVTPGQDGVAAATQVEAAPSLASAVLSASAGAG
jgi:Raf kinase inhibitor-like YbhB/YbcL family protein